MIYNREGYWKEILTSSTDGSCAFWTGSLAVVGINALVPAELRDTANRSAESRLRKTVENKLERRLNLLTSYTQAKPYTVVEN